MAALKSVIAKRYGCGSASFHLWHRPQMLGVGGCWLWLASQAAFREDWWPQLISGEILDIWECVKRLMWSLQTKVLGCSESPLA